MTYFIEYLTLQTWLFAMLPRLVWRRLRQGGDGLRCHAFDSSRAGMAAARVSRGLAGVVVEPLRFRLRDIRDEQGRLMRLRIAYQDLAEVQRDIMASPTFRQAVGPQPAGDRFSAYLAKALGVISLTERQTLWRALFTIQVCAWHLNKEGAGGTGAVYFMERRSWFRSIERYAVRHGITAIPVARAVNLRAGLRRLITPGFKRVLYRLQFLGMFGGRRIPPQQWSTLRGVRNRLLNGMLPRHGPAVPQRRPRVAVESYGHLNVDHPERYSDLFFWQQSTIPGRDVLVTFNHEAFPLDAQKLAELKVHGMDAVAVRPRVARTTDARVFVPRLRGDRNDLPRFACLPGGLEGQWLRHQARTYREGREFWSEFFAVEGVKVYVSWFKYTETHCAIADALQDVGGVTTIYQRSYESHPSPETAVMADVVFTFSQASADIERQSNSRTPYLVTTGYLGDHRFPLLRARAVRIRQLLHQQGARHILAFTDENSSDDDRWHTGHTLEREHYTFLLERVLAEPWLGLVVKPKTPATLRRRLGPVAKLLRRAEATGRCVVFEEGSLQGSYPPAVAALASDVMVHGHLNAGTAGLDAALAGVPTLLLDRLGWPVSPFYRLGVGRVVFTDLEALWQACLEHWKRPEGILGFGDWSPMLDELDPFRDGRAAERTGTYIQWLLEGFKAGLDRETVMADAAERYCARWGKDKITHVNCAQPTGLEATPVAVVPDETDGILAQTEKSTWI